jgi:SAM-dependent methyltransferase
LSALERKYKKKEINVLDDGAGKGYFLSELKEKWNSLKEKKLVSADLKTTAVSLTKTFDVKNIDFKKIGDVLNFIPKRKYDLIISVYGGFHYTQAILKKEVLLKYLYSLNKGGVAIFSFNPILLRSNLDKEHRAQVLIALKKRGFKADFSYLPTYLNKTIPDLPQVYLFVERVK